MYPNATSRPEISVFLEEAAQAESYFIAPSIMPVYSVKARAGRYPRIRIRDGALLKGESTKRGPTGTYNEVDRKFEWDTYDCVDRGLTERVDDVVEEEFADFFEAEVLTSKLVARALGIDYEKRVADLIMNSANFTATAGAVNYTEANLATINFPKDLMDAKTRLARKGVTPNMMIITDTLFNRIRRSTLLQNFLYGNLGSGTSYRMVNQEDIAKAFNLTQCLVASATIDSGKKGQDSSLAPIWSTSHIFLGQVASGDFTSGGVGRTLVWDADCPGGLFTTETYRDEDRRSQIVRVRTNSTEKIIDSNAGELITTNFA
jgi:hypothetical protein